MHVKVRLFLFIWFAGLPGVAAVVLLVMPDLLAGHPLPVPLWVAQLASGAQMAVLVALAVFAGNALAGKVGLSAPAFSALAESRPVIPALRPQIAPGLCGGLAGGVLLWLVSRYSPEALMQLQTTLHMPAIVRLLYGGVTEELLVRWGLMSLVAWLMWRFWQRGTGAPAHAVIWLAIAISALVFGLGHLPAASALLGGQLSAAVIAYIVTANAAFGVIAGFLYWRFGLECAILAHAMAHGVLLVASAMASP